NSLLLNARIYANYAYLKLPAHFFYVCSAQALIFHSSINYTVEEVGQLAVVMSLIMLPAGVISQSVSKAYYGEISGKSKVTDEVYKLSCAIAKKLTMLGSGIA